MYACEHPYIRECVRAGVRACGRAGVRVCRRAGPRVYVSCNTNFGYNLTIKRVLLYVNRAFRYHYTTLQIR